MLWSLGFAMAYGGTWWLARQAGVGAALAHLPALVVVTGAYALTNVYSRGALSEFVAGSAIPLAVASGWALLGAPRARARDWGLLFGSIAVLVGSHVATCSGPRRCAPSSRPSSGGWVGAGPRGSPQRGGRGSPCGRLAPPS